MRALELSLVGILVFSFLVSVRFRSVFGAVSAVPFGSMISIRFRYGRCGSVGCFAGSSAQGGFLPGFCALCCHHQRYFHPSVHVLTTSRQALFSRHLLNGMLGRTEGGGRGSR